MPSEKRTSYAVESATLDIGSVESPHRKIEFTSQNPGPKKRVLLLDDRDDFREVLEDYLTARFYEVSGVPNGVEGLKEILKCPFDLIICDMMMPQLGGEMFYWAVTRMRPAAALRFIFFTGHQNEPKIQAFFQRVNATVLIKPFKLEALNAAISDVSRKLR